MSGCEVSCNRTTSPIFGFWSFGFHALGERCPIVISIPSTVSSKINLINLVAQRCVLEGCGIVHVDDVWKSKSSHESAKGYQKCIRGQIRY
ncbi:hypothetical protein TNCT_500471 [Trichonephila clavata]|uniref:Uncharacterized protein n=1 Tax=Trichonephila clavata TaxID=2740835 RepID=A0A8X6LPI1_TRICU|nr:hypothetical protein TNCT_500471 [Trichonephila clavata]